MPWKFGRLVFKNADVTPANARAQQPLTRMMLHTRRIAVAEPSDEPPNFMTTRAELVVPSGCGQLSVAASPALAEKWRARDADVTVADNARHCGSADTRADAPSDIACQHDGDVTLATPRTPRAVAMSRVCNRPRRTKTVACLVSTERNRDNICVKRTRFWPRRWAVCNISLVVAMRCTALTVSQRICAQCTCLFAPTTSGVDQSPRHKW